tara:strand:- start:778 stop:1569 length:792 start_codon:yes stop_codon:yes gene_type:complete
MSRNLEEVNFEIQDTDDDVSQPRPSSKEKENNFNESGETENISFSEESKEEFDEDFPDKLSSINLKNFGLKLKNSNSSKIQENKNFEERQSNHESQFSFDLEFNSFEDEEREEINNFIDTDIPKLLIQINVIRKNQEISFHEIELACEKLELIYGKMGIFHRMNDKNQILFSMANAVEPGVFPKKRNDRFFTPGVTIFTQLPNVRDGMIIFADMLNTANRLCSILGAILLDEHQHKMTKQNIEHLRENILEHGRKIRLSKNIN